MTIQWFQRGLSENTNERKLNMDGLAQSAFKEAVERYGPKKDVLGALIFFASASGVLTEPPTEDDIQCAEAIIKARS